MRATLAILMTLALVAHVWVINNATAYETYENVAYVRGYLGYFVATMAAFTAGSIASYLLTTSRN